MNRQQFNEPEFSEARIRYDEAATALSQKCCEYLRSLIREHDIIDFSDCEDVPAVCYDGGNHPEYASTMYSTVHKIYVNHEDELVFETEDGQITIERILICDLADVTEMVYSNREFLSLHKPDSM